MKKLIFIVDDNENIRKGYSIILERMGGHRVQTYACPDELLDALSGGQEPDLILTDNDMPGMTGTELVAHLRRNGFTKPIVMSSGSEAVKRDTILMDALDGFLPKPSRIDEIVACVAKALESRA